MRHLSAIALWGALIAAALVGLLLIHAPPAKGELAPELNAWLRSWIPSYCCVTNECCREIKESDVTSLPDDYWRINASGQVLKRTGPSRDGRWWRCHCDYDSAQGKWIVHPTAYTRCLFPPAFGS
jgi:hypothetical protein